MAILALGVSYRRASIELLERLAFTDDDLTKAYGRAHDDDVIDEVVVLSTCNRVEIYASVASYHGGFLVLKRLLAESRALEPDELSEPLYSHYEEDAVEHLFRVAGGLDSMVLGEPQIHAQVREALRRAEAEGAAGPALTALFHSAARAGRRVRTETGLGASPDAFVEAGADLAQEALHGLSGRRAVVVGAGLMASLAVKHLRHRGVGLVRVLNRSLERARALAERTSAEHGDLADLPGALASTDLLVSATGAAGIVLTAETVRDAHASRNGRPLFLLDLAVPRDVEAAAADVPGVTVVDLDGLRGHLAELHHAVTEDLERSSAIVAEEVHRFQVRRHSERLAPLIAALRARGEEAVAAELERFRPRLASLTPDEREAVDALARGIVAKLLHEPVVRLKELEPPGTEGRHSTALTQLFGLELEPPPTS